MNNNIRHIVFDWGDTLMRDDPSKNEPMYLWSEVHAIVGAEPALRELSKDYIISIATSAAQSDEEMVMEALSRVNLSQFISNVFTGKALGRKKTEIEFWKLIESKLQVDAGSILVVGDSFENDVLTSVSAGCSAVWFNPSSEEEHSGERYRTIHHLSELEHKADQVRVDKG